MKIERTINGIKFNIQLLPDELAEAYDEQQEKYDVEDVINYGEIFDEDYIGCDYKTYLNNKEIIAKRMRMYINNGLGMPDARELAASEVISNLKAATSA